MNVLLLSSASVSVPLSSKLKDKFETDGHRVKWLLTEKAATLWKSLKPDTVPDAELYGCSFEGECVTYSNSRKVVHIDSVSENDVCVVCPADFNIVGKAANGIADDVPSSCIAAWLGSGKPIFFCEAMNSMMYANPAHARNVEFLTAVGARFVQPTVKRLACGDWGIGGLADVGTIANIVEGHVWTQPIRRDDLVGRREYAGSDDLEHYRIVKPSRDEAFADYLPRYDEPGAFGAKRKFDRHKGVDVYCRYGSEAVAVEDGEVVDSYQYTGTGANCAWWNDTWCVKVKGRSGVVTYGELIMPEKAAKQYQKWYPAIGTKVKAGGFIGLVGRVLKDHKLRPDIRHHNVSMLHMELRTESCHIDGWKLDGDRDKRLLDPTPYLKDGRMTER